MLGTTQPRKQTSVEDWLDKLKATWSDPESSLPLKLIRIVTDPVILVFLIAIAVLIFYAVKCRKECPECPTLATKTDTSL